MINEHHGPQKNSLTLHQITAAVKQASAAKFPADPLLTAAMSRLTSTIASVIKRHGPILEGAIADVLEGSGRYTVLRRMRLPITAEGRAAALAGWQNEHIALSDNIEGVVDADLVVIDTTTGHLLALQIKRGGGKTDGKKRRQIEQELKAALPTLRACVARHAPRTEIASCAFRIVDIYGEAGFHPDLTIFGWELDAAFNLPVEGWINATTDALRAALAADLPELLAPILADLAMSDVIDKRRERPRAALIGCIHGNL